MELYYQELLNSLQANIILSLRSEIMFFAMKAFGNYDMVMATLMAAIGSTFAMGFNYFLGYYAAGIKKFGITQHKWHTRGCKLFRRYFVFLLLFPWLPFLSIVAVLAGIFRVPPAMAILIIFSGRILYYVYYFAV